MLKIGLTGGIGSGKSSVAERFARHNVPVIDTDIIARELVQPGSPLLDEIIRVFGKDLAHADGSLNRKRLAEQVFNHPQHRKQLETLLHPEIRKEVQRRLHTLESARNPEATPPRYVIIVVPLLFEAGFESLVDRVLVVDSEESRQIARVKQRDGRNVDDISAIMRNQLSRQQRNRKADDILLNDGDFARLEQQVDSLHQKYSQLTS